ncbi:MAG: nucleoside/nucleotide kinase family protein [Micrococcaceae bacterium]|nr:nucleoside/nucleotide kinase family protein [Micrococcaceae bacterium]
MRQLQDIAIDFLQNHTPQPTRTIVGIAGVPAAGKTTFAALFAHELNKMIRLDFAVHVPMDGFHLSNRQLSIQGLSERKGAPETFDVHGYKHLLQRLRQDRDDNVYAPDFSRELGELIAGSIRITPETQVIITEGNYLFNGGAWTGVAAQCDHTWFLDAELQTVQRRLIDRQIQSGKTLEDAQQWFQTVDEPNINDVLPRRSSADRIIGLIELTV